MSNLLAAKTTDVNEVFKYQDDANRTKQYDGIGKIKCIVLEASRDANTPAPAVTNLVGVRMDWMDGGPRGIQAPVLAKARGEQLMILGAVPDLPPIPDPNWKPTWGTRLVETSERDLRGAPKTRVEYERPELLPQPFGQFARGTMREDPNCMVFGPVAQILVHPEGGVATYWIVEIKPDPATGTQMDFVLNVKTRRGYFIGGLFSIHMF